MRQPRALAHVLLTIRPRHGEQLRQPARAALAEDLELLGVKKVPHHTEAVALEDLLDAVQLVRLADLQPCAVPIRTRKQTVRSLRRSPLMPLFSLRYSRSACTLGSSRLRVMPTELGSAWPKPWSSGGGGLPDPSSVSLIGQASSQPTALGPSRMMPCRSSCASLAIVVLDAGEREQGQEQEQGERVRAA